MRDIPFIQSVVASICRVKIDGGLLYVEQLHGTGFFVSKLGHLLTARHVIEKGRADIEQNGGFLAFFPKRDDGLASHCHPLQEIEFAPRPFDIALCTTGVPSKTFYRVTNTKVEAWANVATAGYPMAVVKKSVEHYEIHTRYHRGYVQRVVKPGQLLDGNNPPAFEVDFAITQGMSGAPLFIYNAAHDFLIGVCVGSIQSRVIAYENVEINDASREYRETVTRIEEFGIAHSVLALKEWRPAVLAGKSLGELSNEAWQG